MAITYNVGTNTITVTGYTEGTPCNFTDLYNADVGGGWGVFHKQGIFSFYSEAKLVFGDGSTTTWFADDHKILEFKDEILTSHWQAFIEVKASAHFTLGKLVTESVKNTRQGCTLIFEDAYYLPYLIKSASGSYVYVYSSNITGRRDTRYPGYIETKGYGRFWNVLCDGIAGFYSACSTNTDLFNVIMTDCQIPIGSSSTYNNIFILQKSGYYVIAPRGASDITMKNVNISDTIVNKFGLMDTYTYTLYCINFTYLGTWNFLNWATGGRVERQYEFDLKAIDKDNIPIQTATVKIWDKDSNLIIDTTTNASGDIATQTITRGYYNQPNGSTLQEASPHLIKIEKAGYTTYEADFTLEEKTGWLIALQTSILRNPSMGGGMS